jgi:hypothetical protein
MEMAYTMDHSFACKLIVLQMLFTSDESQVSRTWEEMLVPFSETDAAVALANCGILRSFDCELHSSTMAIAMISLELGSRCWSWVCHSFRCMDDLEVRVEEWGICKLTCCSFNLKEFHLLL